MNDQATHTNSEVAPPEGHDLPTPAIYDDKPPARPRHHKLKDWYLVHKKWSIPGTVVLLILLIFLIPASRYPLAGLVLKQNVDVKVVDATANIPVSGASVQAGNVSAVTNGEGVAHLKKIRVGHQQIVITKKYYKDQSAVVLAPILKPKNSITVSFTATGRQVKVMVRNLINQKALAGIDIEISSLDLTAKTGPDGSALVVLPASVSSEKATLSGNGFNDSPVVIAVSNSGIKENDYNLTPAGKVYFLSKLSGKIDVVKTNLDGSGRSTVVAGTGKEDDSATVLLASRDWKYLALLSRRDTDQAQLYIINTADDSMLTMDSGNATFTPVGWSNDNFIYTVSRNGVPIWAPRGQALKSYDATSGQLLTLDQTGGTGTGSYDYAHETYGQVYIIGRTVVYDKSWNGNYQGQQIADKKAGIYSISAAGGNANTLRNFAYSDGFSYLNSVPGDASQIYYSANQSDGSTNYFNYADGKLNAKDNLSDEFNNYYQNQITYLLSPDGSQTFWSEARDGKHSLLVGDSDGHSGAQIASLSDYQAYGWYTNNYLLASKNASELYILPVSGVKKDSEAIKVTDYHKPVYNFYGYGGGYGGL